MSTATNPALRMERVPCLAAGLEPPAIIGAGALGKLVFDGLDPAGLRQGLRAHQPLRRQDPAMLMDLALVTLYGGDRAGALDLQRQALRHQAIFRVAGLQGVSGAPRLRLLALCAPGDLMVNTPLEFILTGSDVQLDVLYILPDQPLPEEVPEHDVAMVAIAQSDAADPALQRLIPLTSQWPRPVLNRPERLLPLSRTEMGRRLQGIEGVTMPRTLRVARREAEDWLRRETAPWPLPFIIRPVDTHAGQGLAKIESGPDLGAFLQSNPAEEFFAAPFFEFRSADGKYRKFRIVFIERQPHLCHLAISRDWKVHYLSADMAAEAALRAEEAAAMAGFAEGMARRHAAAFAAVCDRVGLDYFGLDCSESPAGDLLIFEVASAMVIHKMDSPLVYPYKQEAMNRTFAAFDAMLDRAAAGTKPPVRLDGERRAAWR